MLIVNPNIEDWSFRNLETSKNILNFVNYLLYQRIDLSGLYRTITFERLPLPRLTYFVTFIWYYYKLIAIARSLSLYWYFILPTHTIYDAFGAGKQASSAFIKFKITFIIAIRMMLSKKTIDSIE